LIFLGTFYVALHNRNLPKWHVTTIWYIGLASVLSIFSIILEWNFGPDFPMSYTKIGIVTEMISNAAVAFTATVMLKITIIRDIIGSRKRAAASE
jgi:hypothetical protein